MYFTPWINWCYKPYAYKVLKMLVKVCALFFVKIVASGKLQRVTITFAQLLNKTQKNITNNKVTWL